MRRARALCFTADALDVRRPRDWQRRAERLYRRAARDLGRVIGPAAESSAAQASTQASELSWARRAHHLLSAAERPYRRMVLVLLAMAGALGLAVAALLLLGCLISPGLRTRLFPPDLCARRPWVASSFMPPNPLSGVGPSTTRQDLFFHTQPSDHPWIEIDLGAPRTIRSLLIENRRDCCQDRAMPINLEVLDGASGQWRFVAQRRSGFTVWTHKFPPVRAQRVRVRLAGTGVLHLRRISLYQW